MQFQKGDIVIRAYDHEPFEWGLVLGFEKVTILEALDGDCEYVYVTVLWPGSYTTQEIDYELWTTQEAFEERLPGSYGYSQKRLLAQHKKEYYF